MVARFFFNNFTLLFSEIFVCKTLLKIKYKFYYSKYSGVCKVGSGRKLSTVDPQLWMLSCFNDVSFLIFFLPGARPWGTLLVNLLDLPPSIAMKTKKNILFNFSKFFSPRSTTSFLKALSLRSWSICEICSLNLLRPCQLMTSSPAKCQKFHA